MAAPPRGWLDSRVNPPVGPAVPSTLSSSLSSCTKMSKWWHRLSGRWLQITLQVGGGAGRGRVTPGSATSPSQL